MTAASPQPAVQPEAPRPRRRRWLRVLLVTFAVLLPVAAAAWGAWRVYRSLGPVGPRVPVARVKRGDVTFTITATGQLRGGNPEALTAPMTGMGEMRIKVLRRPGELVKAGDIVVEFDTTEQTFRMKEAQADLSEAGQQVEKAEAESEAQHEQDEYDLVKAKSDVRLAELEVRKNPLVSDITAKQNQLALDAVRGRLAQIEQDIGNRSVSTRAGIEMQEAARAKAKSAMDTADRNIKQMVLRTRSGGYVSVYPNMHGTFMFMRGMSFPLYRVGDRTYPGSAIAEIPDLENWELSASIGELDRGHIAVGQAVSIRAIALPSHGFHGRIKNMGGTTGMFWDRRFECRMTVDDPSPELRPGMNAEVLITTEVMRSALWIPAQALFEADGRTFVYVPSGSGFAPRDVKLVRRSESQVVVEGLSEGQRIALASPEDQAKKPGARSGGALQAIPK